MKYEWKDLPSPKGMFTVRNACMRNLDTGKIVGNYPSGTKIRVSQKCIAANKTYYRTESAANEGLNYAFEASAFGLRNEIAPSAHSNTSPTKKTTKTTRTPSSVKKQTKKAKSSSPKDGGAKSKGGWFSKLFRRKNG